MESKTNVMRVLDSLKIPYEAHRYPGETAISGVEVAAVLGFAPEKVFKTLVTVGRSGQHYVFVIPVAMELNLRKAAQACGEKSVEMIKAKELLPLTGYVHGGCSPVGMKKPFPTFVDTAAAAQQSICVSAGRIGFQVELPLAQLGKAVALQTAELT